MLEAPTSGAQKPSPFFLEIRPSIDIPLGQSSAYFSSGGGTDVNLDYRLGSMGKIPLFARGGLTYTFLPDRAGKSVSVLSVDGGIDLQVRPSRVIRIDAFGAGGYFLGAVNDLSVLAGNPYTVAGIGFDVAFTPTLTFGVRGAYRNYFGLYQGLGVSIGTTVALGPEPQSEGGLFSSGLQPLSGALSEVELAVPPLFPVFYQYYDNHPVGSAEIKNVSGSTAKNIQATIYIKQFMDNPKTVNVPGQLAPGSTERIDLYALFNENVLSVTEGTKVSAIVTLDSTVGGRKYEDKKVETVRFLNRNAMTWDDNRRAAAFVTAKDPEVLSFAKNVTGPIRDKELRSINKSLQIAIGLHDALDLFGVNYVPDPTTPYVEYSKKPDVPDFLQFPRQTLQYKAGDCDDLSILYSSLLASVGVDAAFITTPGHIFVAVDTGLSPADAAKALIPGDEVITHAGTVWVPVEITLRGKGFLSAWKLGAKEWRQAKAAGKAGFYPIADAWKVYEPVGLPGTPANIILPSPEKVLAAYESDATKYVDQAIYPIVSHLQAQIQATGSLAAMNRLGVVYAKYEQPSKAETQFKKILAGHRNYVPAVLNLGNLYYLNQDWRRAREYYQRANELQPENALAILAVARVDQELENYGDAKRSYNKLKSVDPKLAQQYSYLALGTQGTSRASDIQQQRREVLWDGE